MKPPCVILAGGRSSRMGGGDKGLMPLNGRPMLAHVLEVIARQVSVVLINSNSEPELFQCFALPIAADATAGFQGPLSGLLTGMLWARDHHGATHMLSVPCDTPFLPTDLVGGLQDALRGNDIAIARDEERSHPVIGLWPVALAERLAADLAQGTRAMHRWLAQFRVGEAVFAAHHFQNINTRDELKEAGCRALQHKSDRGAECIRHISGIFS